jgi:hypothetical protein
MNLSAKLNEAMDKGATIQISTYLKVYRVRPKNRAEWRNLGYEMFKTDDAGSTWMIVGQSNKKPRYEIISGNKIQAFI